MTDDRPFRVVAPLDDCAPYPPAVANREIDWQKCVMCQDDKPKEHLQCPCNNKNKLAVQSGYDKFCTKLQQFYEIGSMSYEPVWTVFGQGVPASVVLQHNAAKWHRSCYIKYNETELIRAKKRKASVDFQDGVSTSEIESEKPNKRRKFPFDAKLYSCYFCEQPASPGTLCNVTLLEVDNKIRTCAFDLQDDHLIAKMAGGDLIAQEAKYHRKCLVALYNRWRSKLNAHDGQNNQTVCEGLALAHVVRFIEETLALATDCHPVFRMSDLRQMYLARLHELICRPVDNADPTISVYCKCTYVHNSRLRERILCHFPQMQAQKVGKSYVLLYSKNLSDAVRSACDTDCDDDALCLSKAAQIVRGEMLKHSYLFEGVFQNSCQEDSVPPSLLALVGMILNPTSLDKSQSPTQAALSISQLLQFNIAVTSNHSAIVRHTKTRETPLPVYIGLSTHSRTRKKEIVENMHALGLSVSYTRVLELSTDISRKSIDLFEQEQCVCPPNLKCGLFTTAAVDNLDHNPSSTTSTESFHGTGISLFQHPYTDSCGTARGIQVLNNVSCTSNKSLKVPCLPLAYTTVLPVALHSQQPDVSSCSPVLAECMVKSEPVVSALNFQDKGWLAHVQQTADQHSDLSSIVTEDLNISWAAYHANNSHSVDEREVVISSLLPLFSEDSKSVAMLRHSMDVILSAVQLLNDNQAPVIAVDQPLFALCKLIQWNWPQKYGEDKFVIMFGAFHIEQAWLRLLGKWMQGCGWTDILVECGITTAGVAESLLSVSHVTRARHAHEITAAALHMLIMSAHKSAGSDKSFDAWCLERCTDNVQFCYWFICFKLEMILLVFVGSIREGNFDNFLKALKQMIPWFFAMDSVHYARWLSIHLKDMLELETRHPEVFRHFKNGRFAVCKTSRKFSAISLDQAHEQNNAIVKGAGGAIGLLTDAAALRRWLISGPEISRIVNDFEHIFMRQANTNGKHHEQYFSFQQRELREIQSVRLKFQKYGNPFTEEVDELCHITTRTVAAQSVSVTVHTVEEIGHKLFAEYADQRLVKKDMTIFQPLKKNSLALFGTHARKPGKVQQTIQALKADCNLFSKLYIACQNRKGNLDDFFRHENQSYPPSFSSEGHIRFGTKSDIVGILESSLESTVECELKFDAVVFDGAALVNMLQPKTCRTFSDYATEIFCPFILKQATKMRCTRIDIVWDTYHQGSLKAYTRTTRGEGARRQVKGSYPIPRNWSDFLRNATNKEELFHLLADVSVEVLGKHIEIVSTKDAGIVHSSGLGTNLTHCSHEEADTRILLHVADIVRNGRTRVVVRTVDSDVLVLCIAHYFSIFGITELWVAFGTGQRYRFIPAHHLAEQIGRVTSAALPGFHAFTGCDTVSCFSGRGKRTAWETWLAYPEATRAFAHISMPVIFIPDDVSHIFERFVVLMYRRTSSNFTVNQERKELFTSLNRSIENIPPTSAALTQHVLRATYQAGHCWGQSLVDVVDLPSPAKWGWTSTNEEWFPLWSLLPEASIACRELLRCGCKRRCSTACKCVKGKLACTSLCFCGGDCRGD